MPLFFDCVMFATNRKPKNIFLLLVVLGIVVKLGHNSWLPVVTRWLKWTAYCGKDVTDRSLSIQGNLKYLIFYSIVEGIVQIKIVKSSSQTLEASFSWHIQ